MCVRVCCVPLNDLRTTTYKTKNRGKNKKKESETAAEGNNKMKHTTPLDVILVGGTVVRKLTPAEDQSLLLGVDTRLLLDALLDSPDGVRRVDVDLSLVSSQQLHLDQHDGGGSR